MIGFRFMKFRQAIFLLAVLAMATANASPRTLSTDPQLSNIQVQVTTTADSFVGQLEKFSAHMEWDPSSKLPNKTTITFHFADLKTGNAARDKAMLKWLNNEAYPTGTFQLTGWKQGGGTNTALGTLSLHGVQRSICSRVRISQTGLLCEIDGTAEFDYREFDLPKIRKALVLTVHPRLKVVYHLAGKLEEGH
jgi:polyisoprenoid-binding protein YceI